MMGYRLFKRGDLRQRSALDWVFIILLTIIGFGAANPFTAVAGSVPCGKPHVFIVLSVENKTSDPEWQNHLIALGLKYLVHDELFSTGCYIPAETDSEVQSTMDELVTKSWGGSSVQTDSALSGARKPEYDTTVKVVVKSFSREQSRLRVGLFSSGSAKIKVSLDIILQHADGTIKSAEGTGTGVTTARGVLFQLREKKVFFDESTVGIAVRDAVKMAVKHLMDG